MQQKTNGIILETTVHERAESNDKTTLSMYEEFYSKAVMKISSCLSGRKVLSEIDPVGDQACRRFEDSGIVGGTAKPESGTKPGVETFADQIA